MKKLFGGLNISYKRIIIFSIVIGVIVGLLNSIPFLKDTSFTDPAIDFILWILFGILIIMNSKSNKESAIKCFIFFLISQPIIYLVEVPFAPLGWQLFRYYKYWFIWTLLCLPMGYIGYYIKKDKWWGLIILFPIMLLIASELSLYLSNTIYSFPKHLLSYLFCVGSLIIYPLYMFNNKRIKIVGLTIGILLIIIFSSISLFSRLTYKIQILCSDTINNGDNLVFDDNYKVYLEDDKYGNVYIKKTTYGEEYCVNTEFVREGKTKLILESPDGDKFKFNVNIGRDTYKIKRIN